MNSLLIKVERNHIDAVILNRRRVLVRYTLTDSDLDLIIQQYAPAFASVVLDTNWADCELFPVGELSFFDKFLLKRRLKQNNKQSNKVLIGPHLLWGQEAEDVAPSSFKFGAKSKSKSSKLVLTTCDISDRSKQILNQLIQNRIPVDKLDVMPRVILQNAAKHISTKWCCLVYKSGVHSSGGSNEYGHSTGALSYGTYEEGGHSITRNHLGSGYITTLAVSLNGQLVLVRDATKACESEIVQTFQYLGRTAYEDGDEVTILQEEGLNVVNAEDLSQKLNCCACGTFVRRTDSLTYLRNKYTQFLHGIFLVPKYAGRGAMVFGCVFFSLAVRNLHIVNAEQQRQEQFKYVGSVLPEKEISRLERQSHQKKMLDALLKYKTSQTWSQVHALPVLLSVFETMHKGQFLQSLICRVKNESLSFAVELSPSALYKGAHSEGGPNVEGSSTSGGRNSQQSFGKGEQAKNANSVSSILRGNSEEILARTKAGLQQHFDKQFVTSISTKGKNICLNIDYSNAKKAERPGNANAQRFQYYNLDSRFGQTTPHS
ncbi:MAG: hypothetical protein LBQ43_04670 [Holosporales bacterium]|nr:hypothetical protein [Holosporales bacterium]